MKREESEDVKKLRLEMEYRNYSVNSVKTYCDLMSFLELSLSKNLKEMTLDEDEFIRRFLQHVLPSGFSKIRYFGFLALRYLQENIEKCITLLNKETFLPKLVGLNAMEVYRELFKKDPFCCLKCKKGIMTPVNRRMSAPT